MEMAIIVISTVVLICLLLVSAFLLTVAFLRAKERVDWTGITVDRRVK